MTEPDFHKRDPQRGKSLADYWPLLALLAVSGLMATAISWPSLTLMGWMHGYMGVFLCVFALLKLFNPATFVKGFHMYDAITRQVRAFGYVYPYLELGLGLGYLAHVAPRMVYAATLVLFLYGAACVLLALRRGLDVYCPCMGSILKVPLSTVTLLEDIGMSLMAGFMLWHTAM